MRVLLIMALLSLSTITSPQVQKSSLIPGQYVVVLKESFALPVIKSGIGSNRSPNAGNKELRKQNLDKLKTFQKRLNLGTSSILSNYTDVITGFSAKLSNDEVEVLKQDHAVESVYPDFEFKLTDAQLQMSYTSPPAQTVDCAIATAGGYADGSTKFTWIWIMDTGIDEHPDLNVQFHDPYAISFTGEPVKDLNGHGTMVAGIAAAKDNSIGVVGVSAGAKVVPIKVLRNSGIGEHSWVIAGLDHIAQYAIPGDVINVSLGEMVPGCAAQFPGMPTAMANLGNAGVWICIAAGNDSENSQLYLPACINNKRVFTIAALDCGNACAPYSNIGSNVDWYAVGSNITSTSTNGGYTTNSGTSFASPVVAGIIHSRGGLAPVRGVDITCQVVPPSNPNNPITLTKPLARRQ